MVKVVVKVVRNLLRNLLDKVSKASSRTHHNKLLVLRSKRAYQQHSMEMLSRLQASKMDKVVVPKVLRLVKPKRTREYLKKLKLSGMLTSFASDPANFINVCAGKTLTNGQQTTTGSCNGIR